MKVLTLSFAFVLGCATGTKSAQSPTSANNSSSKKGASVPAPAMSKETPIPPPPLYTEKVTGISLEQMRSGSCPQDTKWESFNWEKIVPLANACVKAKDWVKVEKMGDVLAKRAYLVPWGAYYLALDAESRKDFARAVWMLELALKKAPGEGIFYYEIGRIHWELGNTPLSIKNFKEASDKNPSLTEAHWVLGQVALNQRKTSDAKTYLKRALESSPKHFPSLMSMAQLEINSKNWVEAEKLLTQAISINAHSTRARLALVKTQEDELKKLSEALSGYKEIKKLAADKKLDEVPIINFDEKIRNLQDSIKRASAAEKVTARQPSGEEKVAK
jgi:tetratricopeptide (TPR) repeat protein